MLTSMVAININKFKSFVEVINDSVYEGRGDQFNVLRALKETLNKIVKSGLYDIVQQLSQVSIDQAIIQSRIGDMGSSKLSNLDSEQMTKVVTKI